MLCGRALLCLRTTMAIILSEAWPINNAQNELQVRCSRCSLPPLHFLDNAIAAKGVASVGRLILHAPIRFLRPIDLPAVGKRICTPSRIASGSPSRARTSAKKASMRASDMGVSVRPNPEIYPVALHHTHLSVAAFYATGLGTGVPSIIFNNQQSVAVQKWLEPISKFPTTVDPL